MIWPSCPSSKTKECLLNSAKSEHRNVARSEYGIRTAVSGTTTEKTNSLSLFREISRFFPSMMVVYGFGNAPSLKKISTVAEATLSITVPVFLHLILPVIECSVPVTVRLSPLVKAQLASGLWRRSPRVRPDLHHGPFTTPAGRTDRQCPGSQTPDDAGSENRQV
jgi:hypothetical protein